jgi:hypothetical protein
MAKVEQRNCPKLGMSIAPSVDLAAIWRAKWADKPLFGGPQGYATCPSDPFRTVSSPLDFSHSRRVANCVG